MIDVPHLSWPLRVSELGYTAHEQDTTTEIAANVAVITCCPLGYRVEAVEFGIPDPEFVQQPIDLLAVERQITDAEPRAVVTLMEFPNPSDTGNANVVIDVAMAGAEEVEL